MLEVFTFIVAVILLVLPYSDWLATYILNRALREAESENIENIALRERRNVAAVLAVASTLNGILATIRLLDLHPAQPITLLLLSATLILSSIPNLYWLSLYIRSKFHK